jgi:hypothetical protein
MSIKKYTNFEQIDGNVDNKGKFLQAEDLFIVSKNEIEETDFGECKYDVMEVSVYDINSNLLPHKTGNNVAYIKTGDIKNYMYNVTNKGGQKELAIDIEKLLSDLGFTNGILKVNINFVRNRVGTDNELERTWIQEISPSREEIRILPLKTKWENVNNKNTKDFSNLGNLNKDFKYYKKNILNALDSLEPLYLSKINDSIVNRIGNDFKDTIRKDFGLRNFDAFIKKIFDDFKESIKHWVNNRYYDLNDSTFGKPSEIRFIDCDQYDFNFLLGGVQSLLNNAVAYNIKTLKRRGIDYKQVPQEFAVVELRKQIQNNLSSFQTPIDIRRNVYAPDKVELPVTKARDIPVLDILPPPKQYVEPIETPPQPPIFVEAPIFEEPTPIPVLTAEPMYTTTLVGGGGGGGGYIENDFGIGYGKENIIERDMTQRENLQ